MVTPHAAFLRFRLRQAGKFIKEIPLLYAVALLAILGFGVLALHSFMDDLTGGLIAGGALLGVLLLLHLRRKDYHFVCLAESSPRRVFCADYWLVSAPVIVLECVCGHWFVAPAIMLGCVGVSMCGQVRRATKGFPVPRFIPSEAFELRSGCRRYGGFMVAVYAIAWIGLCLPYVSFALLWLELAILSDFFKHCEPEAVLCSLELPAGRFIRRKLWVNLRLFALAVAPVCLLYALIRPAEWWLPLGFLTLSLLNVALLVLMKYTFYRPSREVTSAQASLWLSIVGIWIPFLAPITLFLLIRYTIMSQRNLTPHLYVYN